MTRRLRVVAGDAGGLHLVAPPHARPTADRVREAVFSALGPGAIEGAVVLDLYAGSGAMAIEALSRGATRAVLVDHDREAQEACTRNLETTRLADRARVHRGDVARYLRGPAPEERFDLVCCDPPYSMPDEALTRVLGTLADRAGRWLADGAVVVVERPGPVWDPPEGWSASWQRRYGDTLVTILHVTG